MTDTDPSPEFVTYTSDESGLTAIPTGNDPPGSVTTDVTVAVATVITDTVFVPELAT